MIGPAGADDAGEGDPGGPVRGQLSEVVGSGVFGASGQDHGTECALQSHRAPPMRRSARPATPQGPAASVRGVRGRVVLCQRRPTTSPAVA